jgi:putative flippase GtrA
MGRNDKPMLRAWLNKRNLQHLLRPRSFGRFAVTGVVNTIVGVGNFPLLYWLLGNLASVNALLIAGWLISTTSAFFLHKFVTFKSSGSYHKESVKFLILSLVTLGINLLVMNGVMYFTKAHPVLAQLVISVVLSAALMILSYLGMNHLVFKARSLLKK